MAQAAARNITRREAVHLAAGLAVAAVIPAAAAAEPAFDPEWYVLEMDACDVKVVACVKTGDWEGIAEFYPRGLYATPRFYAARERYCADPDSGQKVRDYCLRTGRTYG